jgi:hypothetical protein
MAETAIDDLYDIMRDPASGMRQRLNAAISASRVERLSMPGEAMPEAVLFLREIVGTEHEGSRFRVEYRREAASALSYSERRAKKAELQYSVPDQDERHRQWRGVLNGCIRLHLGRRGLWPERRNVLFRPDDTLEMPPHDPELGLAALLYAGSRKARRPRAIDERSVPTIASDAQRLEILRSIAKVTHGRLKRFGLAGGDVSRLSACSCGHGGGLFRHIPAGTRRFSGKPAINLPTNQPCAPVGSGNGSMCQHRGGVLEPLAGLAPSSWANLSKPILGEIDPGGMGGLDRPVCLRKFREPHSGIGERVFSGVGRGLPGNRLTLFWACRWKAAAMSSGAR